MNKEKRMAYCTNNTQVGFHTGNGTTDNVINFEVADNINIINSCNRDIKRYKKICEISSIDNA